MGAKQLPSDTVNNCAYCSGPFLDEEPAKLVLRDPQYEHPLRFHGYYCLLAFVTETLE